MSRRQQNNVCYTDVFSSHFDQAASPDHPHKPIMIEDYHSQKCGVDRWRNGRDRWTLQNTKGYRPYSPLACRLFMVMLAVGALAGFVIYHTAQPSEVQLTWMWPMILWKSTWDLACCRHTFPHWLTPLLCENNFRHHHLKRQQMLGPTNHSSGEDIKSKCSQDPKRQNSLKSVTQLLTLSVPFKLHKKVYALIVTEVQSNLLLWERIVSL